MSYNLAELIAGAPWREAVTYRDTWPHEYVLSEKDGQQELLDAVCQRVRAGEGVSRRHIRPARPIELGSKDAGRSSA